MTKITITHRLPSGTTFAVTTEGHAESVFVAGRIADPLNAMIGGVYDAMLVPNPRDTERTPWQVLSMKPLSGGPTPLGLVANVLTRGGVWTPEQVNSELGWHDVGVVRGHLLTLFNEGGCSKFELRTSPSTTNPTKEWFTCSPHRADVDEWEDRA
jgi:hypothetical protein